jgi:hypothetical protein
MAQHIKSHVTVILMVSILVVAGVVGYLANRSPEQRVIKQTETITVTSYIERLKTIISETTVTNTVTTIVGNVTPSAGKPELVLLKAGATHYEVRIMPEGKRLIYLEPSEWQGNSDVYSVAGVKRVGHHWSHFLMLSPGRWLTDRVESEGQDLVTFSVLTPRGRVVSYFGCWSFRDYFITCALHHLWIQDGIFYRYVKTSLKVLRDIPEPVGAIWVELMNDPDYYRTAVAKTREGLIVYDMRGVKGHALKEYTLEPYGWIALIDPVFEGVRGSPVLVPVWSTHAVHPTVCNCPNVDNIELHLLGFEERMLKKGEFFELHYLLIVGTETSNYDWIERAIQKAKPVIASVEDAQK